MGLTWAQACCTGPSMLHGPEHAARACRVRGWRHGGLSARDEASIAVLGVLLLDEASAGTVAVVAAEAVEVAEAVEAAEVAEAAVAVRCDSRLRWLWLRPSLSLCSAVSPTHCAAPTTYTLYTYTHTYTLAVRSAPCAGGCGLAMRHVAMGDIPPRSPH